MNSCSVDLIYLDPPFNSNRTYSAPIGSQAAGAAFKDTWTLSDVDEAWHGEIAEREPSVYAAIDAAGVTHGKGMKSYLIMMAVRLLEMRRLLKSTGSVYLHCDPTASHYLKTLMDAVFGRHNFRNEIVWCYKSGGANPKRTFSRKHDVILWYTQSSQYRYNRQVEKSYNRGLKPYRFKGVKEYQDSEGWYTVVGVKDYWQISVVGRNSKERVGYPTQKPLALLERIVKANSNEGDVVLDPFCGCATACVAAERLDRQWIGIDLSPLAADLVERRMRGEGELLFKAVRRSDIPQRSDAVSFLPDYRTHKHMLYGRQEGVCAGCRVLFPFRNMTVDHVIAQAKGGTDHLDNLQLLCGACNSLKGTGTQEELLVKLKAEGIRTV